MRIVLEKKQNPSREKLNSSNPYKNRIGFWAEVTNVNSVTNTVDITNDIGQKFLSIPVSSSEWVCVHDDYVSGDLRLPPIKSRVFVLTPNPGSISGAFVLCSGYAIYEPTQQENFAKTREEKEEFDVVKKVVSRNGWSFEEKPKAIEMKSKDEKIALNVDIENKEIKINAFDNAEITITESDIIIKSKKLKVEGEDVTVKGQNVSITGGKLSVKGSVTPSGSGCLSAVPYCLFTGAPHSGSEASGT